MIEKLFRKRTLTEVIVEKTGGATTLNKVEVGTIDTSASSRVGILNVIRLQ